MRRAAGSSPAPSFAGQERPRHGLRGAGRVSDGRIRRPRPGRAFGGAPPRSRWPTAPRSTSPASRTSAQHARVRQPPGATLGARRHHQLGLASVGSRFHRSRIENLLDGRGASVQAGRDRLRRRPAAVRPHQLHAPHRRRTPPATCSARASSSGQSRGYIKGMIDDRPQRHRHGQFLGEFSMLLEQVRLAR